MHFSARNFLGGRAKGLALIAAILLSGSASRIYAQTFANAPLQSQVTYDDKPTVYWTEPDRSFHRAVSYREFVILALLPWTRMLHTRMPWKGGELIGGPAQCAGSNFFVDKNGTAYVLSDSNPSVCAIGDSTKPRILVGAGILQKPSSIVGFGKALFVSDPRAHMIFVFSKNTGSLLQSIPVDSLHSPDKLVVSGHELIGFNYSTFVLARYEIEGSLDPHDTRELEFLNPSEHAVKLSSLVQPIDVAVAGDLLYFLDAGRKQIALLPFGGSRLFFLNYQGIVAEPTTIAATYNDGKARIILSDKYSHTFVVLQAVIPVDLYISAETAAVTLPRLYKYLYIRKLLPVAPYTVSDGDTLASIIANQQVIPVGSPDNVYQLLCELNKCDDPQTWQPTIGEKLLLPHLQLSIKESRECIAMGSGAGDCVISTQPTLGDALSQVAIPEKLLTGESLQEFKTLEAEKCSATTLPSINGVNQPSRAALEKRLLALNSTYTGNDILQERHGTYVVPILGIMVSTLVSDRVMQADYTKLQKAVGGAAVIPIAGRSSPQPQFGSPSQDMAPSAAQTDKWRQMISQIKADLYPPDEIAIVDKIFSGGHPEFYRGNDIWTLSYYIPLNADVSHLPPSKPVTVTGPSPLEQYGLALPDDHGTYIAALIGGGRIGLYPRAHLYAVKTADFGDALHNPDFKARIFNLSLGEKKGDTPATLLAWKTEITRTANKEFLFVMAAGNGKSPVQDTALASAGERTNVLAVAACWVDRPGLWVSLDGNEGSNFSDEFVGIVAPGSHILSATQDGRYGYGDGTSVATALVSSAAGLLHAEHDAWSPWQIKYRLMATSDLPPWTEAPGKAKAGVLNEKRAVEHTDHSVVIFAGETKECVADLDPGALDQQLSVVVDRRRYVFTYRQLLRLHRRHSDPNSDPNDQSMTAYYLMRSDPNRALDDPAKGAELVRIPPFDVATITGLTTIGFSPVAEVGSDCGTRTSLQVTQVDELYNPMRSRF